MKKPFCHYCKKDMEPSGQTLVKPATDKTPNRYITTNHTCPNCGDVCETPQHIIDNAKRPPSPSNGKPKQRMAYNDALILIHKRKIHHFRKVNPGHPIPENIDKWTLIDEDFEFIIRKLTRP